MAATVGALRRADGSSDRGGAGPRCRPAGPSGQGPGDLPGPQNEKVFEAMASDAQPAIPEDRTLDALVGVWLASIYGTTPFPTA